VDDFPLFYSVLCGCGGFGLYPRSKYIHAPMMALATYVTAAVPTSSLVHDAPDAQHGER